MAKKVKVKRPAKLRKLSTATVERVYIVLCEIRDMLRAQIDPQADVARDIKKLEQARKF